MMFPTQLPILFLAVSTVVAVPVPFNDNVIVIPDKRSALVLDRILVALQKALREDNAVENDKSDVLGPRASALLDNNAMMLPHWDGEERARVWFSKEMDTPLVRPAPLWRRIHDENTGALERRYKSGTGGGAAKKGGGPKPGQGRVIRCFFNAVTCF